MHLPSPLGMAAAVAAPVPCPDLSIYGKPISTDTGHNTPYSQSVDGQTNSSPYESRTEGSGYYRASQTTATLGGREVYNDNERHKVRFSCVMRTGDGDYVFVRMHTARTRLARVDHPRVWGSQKRRLAGRLPMLNSPAIISSLS